MHTLMLHRTCDLGPVRAITAAINATGGGFDARFRVEGHLAALDLPQARPAMRADGLWKSTCFEVFWQPIGQAGYSEFNFSPSQQWATYDFDSYREGMRGKPVEEMTVQVGRRTDWLDLHASVVCDCPAPAQIGLSAVVEHAGGTLQYWALAFGPGRPDFHSEACRQMIVER